MISRTLLQPVRIAGRRVLQPIRTPLPRNATLNRLNPSLSSALHTTRRLPSDSPSPSASDPPPPDQSTPSATATPTAENALEAEHAAQKREIIDLKDRYLRSRADFINLQERTKRDVAAARSFAISAFAKDLIESVDNFERALETVSAETLRHSEASPPRADATVPPTTANGEAGGEMAEGQNLEARLQEAIRETTSLYNGLKMTERILLQTLGKHGLERIDPASTGEKFDPIKHEALFQQPVEGKEDGTVFHTQQKGFLLNGRTLRAAKVGIVRGAS